MDVYSSVSEAAEDLAPQRPVLTVGNFDGVHRGHRAILNDLVSWARAEAAPSVVITFANHPMTVLTGHAPPLVTSTRHRLLLFKRLGIRAALTLVFDDRLSQTPAEVFIRDIICGRLQARGLQLGYDSRFGQGAKGTPELARQIGAECGLEVRTAVPVMDCSGRHISSTRIRELVQECRFNDAAELLGRRPSVYGVVVEGAHRGRLMGYPTANVDVGIEVQPPVGVYATIARLNGESYPSMTNIGHRPTMGDLDPNAILVETHLFDFNGDLYGHNLEVEFVEKLRDERKFAGLRELQGQLQADERAARQVLAELFD